MSFTQRARRAQIIEETVQLVAEKGYSGATLSGIAQRAGISKPAVLHHFSTKGAVVEAAYHDVLQRLVDHVAKAVAAAPAEHGPAAYIREMIHYLATNPHHVRMIIESLSNQGGDRDSSARWRPLADIIASARTARRLDPNCQNRTTALIIGGAIDSIITEQLHDPDYDSATAAEHLIKLVETSYR
ncbi:TetR/AcrR family transcriptional regulator [Nesterenkonia sp. Hz 6-5]|nr:TetR/AcrR family transcriptional regulator [Nesterenkonia haasae]